MNTAIQSSSAVSKDFRMHPHLLFDVIMRQAGTLGKALLEGVMNSIDAGATKVEVTLDADSFAVSDDGRGFVGEKEIEEFFATFGTPHEDGDARFGRFRMGRGQMFAFARTRWSSNDSIMDVDIKNQGLKFLYEKAEKPIKGCRVEGRLYETLTAYTLTEAIKEVERNCLYVEIEILINGQKINKDPKAMKWTSESDYAWVKIASGGSKGIDVYQQGVFVETIPAHSYGLSGTVVTKPGCDLKVNFARNQVIRSCSCFQAILKMLGKEGSERMKKRTVVEDSEIETLAQEMTEGNSFKYLPHEKNGILFIQDTTGRRWSAAQVRRINEDKFQMRPDQTFTYSVADEGDRRGDKLMQSGVAFVLSTEFVEQFGGSEKKGFSKDSWFRHTFPKLTFVAMADLKEDANASYKLVSDKQLTKMEEIWIKVADSAACGTLANWENTRILRVGISDVAHGWTDGKTYIAINRDFLQGIKPNAHGFAKLGTLLLHEYIHEDESSRTHTHTPEFYRNYHDRSMDEISRFVSHAIFTYHHTVVKRSKAKGILAAAKTAELRSAEARLFGAAITQSEPDQIAAHSNS